MFKSPLLDRGSTDVYRVAHTAYTVDHTGNTIMLCPEHGRNNMVFTLQSDGSMLSQENGN